MRDKAVTVWWVRTRDAHDGLRGALDATERGRAAAYRRPVDVDRFVLGAALVRTLAGRHLGRPAAAVAVNRTCPDCGRPHGRVRLPGAGLEVSVTHAGGLVGVAVSAGPAVGLDVEGLDPAPDPAELAATVLAPDEAAVLAGLPVAARPAAFLRYWTRKEALLKATGEGIVGGLTDLAVTGPDEPAAVRAWRHRPERVARMRLHDLAADARHVAALAVDGPGPVDVEERWATAILSLPGADGPADLRGPGNGPVDLHRTGDGPAGLHRTGDGAPGASGSRPAP